MVRWWASILSLGSGDGIPVLVGQNKMCQKWQNQYNTMALYVLSVTMQAVIE